LPSETELDAPDPLLRPAWEDTPDETDADRLGQPPAPPAKRRSPVAAGTDWVGEDLPTLLGPLCDATEALARLDARAASALDPVRDGLTARMALAEAAGWLAHAHAWVHPLDLALRDLGLAGSTALTATGSGHKALPHTFRDTGGRDWDDPPFEAMADGDRVVADALALARALRRLPGAGAKAVFGSTIAAAEMLELLGAGWLKPDIFTAWWTEHAPPARSPNRHSGSARERGPPDLPPLLAVAQAAAAWMETTVTAQPAPHLGLFAAVALLARRKLSAVFLPVWAAYPAAGFGDRDALPTLRTDAATRVVDWGKPVTWPHAFLHLVAESARAGLRELDRLEAVAMKGRTVTSDCDKRSRLPDAFDALLRVPALTPKTLAARLKIAPQTGTALLRELQGRGMIREVTGRGSFRAFAL